MKYPILLALLFSALLFSCKKEKVKATDPEAIFELHLQPYYGNQLFQLDSACILPNGQLVKISNIRFYASNCLFSNGINIKTTLYNLRENGTKLFSTNQDISTSASVNFYFGIDSLTNHSDPSVYGLDDPLNILNANDMHWSWNPGYIFLVVQGIADTTGSGAMFNQPVLFHIGKDYNYRLISAENLQWNTEITGSGNKLTKAVLCLEVNKLFENIDLKTQNMCHSDVDEQVLSLQIGAAFVSGIKKCDE